MRIRGAPYFSKFFGGKIKIFNKGLHKKAKQDELVLKIKSYHDETKILILQCKLNKLFDTLQKRRTKKELFSRIEIIKFRSVCQLFTV